jgi:hypothetical protein
MFYYTKVYFDIIPAIHKKVQKTKQATKKKISTSDYLIGSHVC